MYRNASRAEGPSHGHGQHAQRTGEVWPCGFRDMRMDIYIHTHTHRDTFIGLSQYFTPSRGKIMMQPLQHRVN